jgi:hypothetical protein
MDRTDEQRDRLSVAAQHIAPGLLLALCLLRRHEVLEDGETDKATCPDAFMPVVFADKGAFWDSDSEYPVRNTWGLTQNRLDGETANQLANALNDTRHGISGLRRLGMARVQRDCDGDPCVFVTPKGKAFLAEHPDYCVEFALLIGLTDD